MAVVASPPLPYHSLPSSGRSTFLLGILCGALGGLTCIVVALMVSEGLGGAGVGGGHTLATLPTLTLTRHHPPSFPAGYGKRGNNVYVDNGSECPHHGKSEADIIRRVDPPWHGKKIKVAIAGIRRRPGPPLARQKRWQLMLKRAGLPL